jgi:hypothetical protein
VTRQARHLATVRAHRAQGHDEAFAAFRAEREAQREAEVKVTWRKVSEDTGGGWSGLGPNGALVFVDPRTSTGFYRFGCVLGHERVTHSYADTLARAKRAAEALFTHEAPTGAEEDIMSESTIPTAQSLVNGLEGFEATAPGKAPYVRIRNGKTLAYASARKDGVLLDFASKVVEPAPKKFQAALEAHGTRTTMRVTASNEKLARELLAWVAKQS